MDYPVHWSRITTKEMCVPFERNGIWYAEVPVGGRKLRKSLEKGSSRNDALKRETLMRMEAEGAAALPPNAKNSLLNIARLWFAKLQLRRASAETMLPHLRATEAYLYGNDVERAVEVAERIVADGRAQGLADRTINRRLYVLRASLKAAGHLVHKQIKTLPEPIIDGTILTRDEVAKLAEAARSREVRKAILIAANTGVSRKELLALTPANITQDGELTLPPKKRGAKTRYVPVPRYIKPLLFTVPLKLTDQQLRYGWEQACLDTGIKANFRDLHHTYAAWLIESGADITVIRSVLGHMSRLTARRYDPLFKKSQSVVERLGSKK